MYLPRGVEIFDTTWPAVGAYQKEKKRKKNHQKNPHPKKQVCFQYSRCQFGDGGRAWVADGGATGGREVIVGKLREIVPCIPTSSERGNQPTSCLFSSFSFHDFFHSFSHSTHDPFYCPAGRAERGIPMAGWELIASNHPLALYAKVLAPFIFTQTVCEKASASVSGRGGNET